MRVVADTNTVVSGLLWHGAPREVLELAHRGEIELFTSPVLLAELEDVLHRTKFVERLERIGAVPHDLVVGYAALATVTTPPNIPPAVLDDPDDDDVLACAVAAQASAIVSGDGHLLALEEYQGIPILRAPEIASIETG